MASWHDCSKNDTTRRLTCFDRHGNTKVAIEVQIAYGIDLNIKF